MTLDSAPMTPRQCGIAEEDAQWLRMTLTPRQREIVQLIGRGLTNQEIAERLTVTLSTVEQHIRRIPKPDNMAGRAGERRFVVWCASQADSVCSSG